MPRYRVTITSPDREAMLDLVRTHQIQVLDHGQQRNASTDHRVDAIVSSAEIKKLQDAGFSVQRHEDVDKVGKARQREVGRGNRYEDREPS